MIKSPQPSVGVMKWLALAEDLDDLSISAGSICCAAESKAQPFPAPTTISNLIIIKTSSVTFINPMPVWILEDLLKRSAPYAAVLHTHGLVVNKDREIN